MKNKYIIIYVIFLIIMPAALTGAAMAKGVDNKSKTGTYDVVLGSLRQRRAQYQGLTKQLNKKILKLQKEARRVKEPKKKEGLEKEIEALVISFADAQYKVDSTEAQIRQYEQRKEEIEFMLQLESALSKDEKRSTGAKGLKTGRRAPKEEKVSEEYKIAPHDEIQINVYGEPDLAKTVRVAADGSISYPLVGRVNVDGLTARGLEEKLSGLLSGGGFIINPQVGVYVEKFSSMSILGAVRNPGSYELKGKASIIDAIAQAGGFAIEADMNNIKILRIEGGQQRTIQVRLGDIRMGIEDAEIALKPNDTIFVEKIGKVIVLGEVERPGTFELKDKTTIVEAIALAGGFTDVAAINRTRIIREGLSGRRKVIRVKVTDITYRGRKEKDIELIPGDVIYVPESLL